MKQIIDYLYFTKLYPMKKILFAILLFSPLMLSAQSWQWAKSSGGINLDGCNSIAADASGNVYAVGYFFSPSITFGTFTLTNVDGGVCDDLFIVKYDIAGNVLWAKSAGESGYDEASSVSVDAEGNVLVTGFFSSHTITFGTTTLSNNGINNVFIAKYDPSGNVIWAKSTGGTRDDAGIAIATDATGDIYVTGAYTSPSITFGTFNLTNYGGNDVFLAKYDSSGNVLWAKSAGGLNNDRPTSIATDLSGNIFVAGEYNSDSIAFGTTELVSGNMFLAKYDATGNLNWVRNAGGNFADAVATVTTDKTGNVIIAGYFAESSVIFGTTTLHNTGSIGSTDIFMVKYSTGGNVLWAKNEGTHGNDAATSVSADGSGNLYLTGYFGGNSIILSGITFTNSGGNDLFVIKYDPNGNAEWANCHGGTGDDVANAITTDATGNVFIAGAFNSDTLNFGSTNLTNATPTTSNTFLSKLSSTEGTPSIMVEPEKAILYPNPVTNCLFISCTENITKIVISNLMGQTIYNLQYHSRAVQVDISELPSGVYFVEVNRKEVRKFVKQ